MGTITGLVTDSSGAVIPNAVVVATNTATGGKAQTLTSSTGNYVIPGLQVGSYDVSVAVSGFKTWGRPAVGVSSNGNLRVDVALEVGQTSERVTINAEAPPLKTESTEVSTTMERKLVNDVPSGGGRHRRRNAQRIQHHDDDAAGEERQRRSRAWDDLQVGGGQQHDWNVSVDGLSVEMGWRNHVGYMNRLTPSVDSVEEFRIETAAFKAENSRASGGNISVTTKSGTNELHGQLASTISRATGSMPIPG